MYSQGQTWIGQYLSQLYNYFLAEIGDKTQFAALAVASQTNSIYSVLFREQF